MTPAEIAGLIPAGLTVVSKAEFYACLMAERRSVHPHPERLATEWMLTSERRLWGWSSTGYAGRTPDIPETYALGQTGRRALAARDGGGA